LEQMRGVPSGLMPHWCAGHSNGASTVVPAGHGLKTVPTLIPSTPLTPVKPLLLVPAYEKASRDEPRNPVPEENANPSGFGSTPTATVGFPTATGAVVTPTTAVPQSSPSPTPLPSTSVLRKKSISFSLVISVPDRRDVRVSLRPPAKSMAAENR